jgi:hypothetical protein
MNKSPSNQARRFIVGQIVQCPPDRGDKGYQGVVTSVGTDEQKNYQGVPYFWIEVKGPRHKSVWPSHRLG